MSGCDDVEFLANEEAMDRVITLTTYNEDISFEIANDTVDNLPPPLLPIVLSSFNQPVLLSHVVPLAPMSSAHVPNGTHPFQCEHNVLQQSHADNTTGPSSSMMFNEASCKRLAHDLEVGGSARRVALEGIRGHVRALSFDSAGCRVVQQAMKVSGADVATGLAKELEGCVKDAAYSPYANYVIQRILEALPHSSTSFVAKELLGVAANVSQHRFGCRILCRLFEHCAKSIAGLAVADELMTDILALSRHEYGHYVLQALVEHGSSGHQCAIAQAFVGDLAFHVEDGSTSYVLESIFMHCAEHEQQGLLVALLRGGPHVP